jgi:hypothetical protein
VRDDMELRNLLLSIIGLGSLSLLIVFGAVCNASSARLTITNVNVQLVETRNLVGNRTVHVYDIIAFIHNSGDMISDKITVYFRDPEFNVTAPQIKLDPYNVSLDPNGNMTFILHDWPTPLVGDVPLNISFSPSSPNVVETSNNHGHYLYTLHIGDNTTTTSTPGFEIVILLGAIIITLLMVKKRRK